MRAATATTSFIVSLALVASLAACTSTAGTDASGCKPTGPGTLSDSVKVSGTFDTKPTVVITSPLTATATQRTVAIAGTGAVANKGQSVSVQITLYNAATGAVLTSTGYAENSATTFAMDETKVLPGLVKTIECSPAGSRLVGVIPPADGFGEAGNTQLGVTGSQSFVVVVDVLSIVAPPLPKANGVDQPATPGFPAVVLDAAGRPTITIPDSAPPTDLKIAVLKKGDGAVVPAKSNVVVQYEGINWNTKKIFDESWARGAPSTFNTAQVIAGFTKALEGQKVGSQVIVIVPPAEGYGSAGAGTDIGPTDTIVFVVDIVGLG